VAASKRFYKAVSVAEEPSEPGAALLLLDGRPVKTPGRQAFQLPNEAVAEAVAREWRAQGKVIDPVSMPLTRLANTAIDGVRQRQAEIAGDILGFAGTDLVCYRADGPAALRALQAERWDPVLNWTRERYGARFRLAEGVIHVAQPAQSLRRIGAALEDFGPFGLGALHVMTALTGSALLSLAAAEGRLTPDQAWDAAHVDEDWQISQWGEDPEAAARRASRYRDYAAAAEMLRLLRGGDGRLPGSGGRFSR
jgi:chaperone required for assembly of F1-ATPase